MTILEGELVSGLGRAADFTQLDWVRRQLVDLAGIDPYPGTVNLSVPRGESLDRWLRWKREAVGTMRPPGADFCSARCLPVRIDDRLPAAIVVPEVGEYPEDKLELVAAVPVRAHLGIGEGARVRVERCGRLAVSAALFDLDGTLVDSVGAYLEIARVAAAPHGFEVTEDQVRHALSTGSSFWGGVIPADRPDRDALRRSMTEHAGREWPRVLRERCRVFEGVEATLDALRASGIRLGIVSGARPEVLELLREREILERFDAVVLGADVARRKPDPEGMNACLEKLRVAPAAALYVGDTPVDIRTSRAAGVAAVGVLTGAADSAALSAHEPDRIFASHAELAAAVERL